MLIDEYRSPIWISEYVRMLIEILPINSVCLMFLQRSPFTQKCCAAHDVQWRSIRESCQGGGTSLPLPPDLGEPRCGSMLDMHSQVLYKSKLCGTSASFLALLVERFVLKRSGTMNGEIQRGYISVKGISGIWDGWHFGWYVLYFCGW